ncbi:MAG: histidine kinase [Gammaproteobacteria bacterium HGW-Gammaproteobacteria-1]|jgi:CBS domain-containing protein|nr:MAG: histidine kinase [Gammaproteobacteria bacterium HGW-Gammaproteobacteria-1]
MSDKAIVRVREAMNGRFDVIDGMATVSQALRLMRDTTAECLMVDKRHADDEYGMLLISDIARHVLGQDRSPERVNVYEVMAKPVIAVDPEMDIRYCARLFTRFDLTRAPVIENGKVVGIVSFADLVMRGLCKF